MKRTLRGRVAVLALGITACWLTVLTVALNILVDASTTDNEPAEHRTLVGSIIVAVLLLLGLYPVLRLTVRRALQPVELMTQRAARWSISEPGRRFGQHQPFAEIDSLAQTLDVLLDRVAALLRYERTISAELSHELRTPLTWVLAETELLRRSTLAAEDAASVEGIRTAALTMQRIVETLLAGARADHAETQGRTLVSELVQLATASAHRRCELELTVTVQPDDLHVAVDHQLGERILAPVLANAMRFAETSVSVRTTLATGRVRIEIGNDGPPIPADEVEAIFLPGVTSRSLGSEHSGAGLGLPLARRLARAVEGDVILVQHDPALFRIDLPT
ncbi:MAG TPA: HAMP domain-containing sensor histidine kinase [Jatrophihabitans sp.]|jgi:signal transduction histidine kinase